MKNFKVVIFIFAILCFSEIVFSQETKTTKCVVPKGLGGKYKLLSEAFPIGNSNEVLLEVIIKPKHFNKADLIELTKRIKTEYCNINEISLSMFDSKKVALGWHYDFVTSKGSIDRRRGIYFLNRKTNEEVIEFSTKFGNPISEVKLNLSEK